MNIVEPKKTGACSQFSEVNTISCNLLAGAMPRRILYCTACANIVKAERSAPILHSMCKYSKAERSAPILHSMCKCR